MMRHLYQFDHIVNNYMNQYPGFLDGEDYVEETTEDKTYKNNFHDKYQQYRFDFRNLHYFIDSDGYLVARINGTYDYTTEGPK